MESFNADGHLDALERVEEYQEDVNYVLLGGRLATDSEVKHFESGAVLTRLLVTCRQENPRRRVDVVPVTVWDQAHEIERGTRVQVTGSLQRRFWESPDGRRSRMELVAHDLKVVPTREGRGF